MKKLLGSLVLVIALGFAGIGIADEDGTGAYVNVGYNWFNFDEKRGLDNDNAMYFGLGIQSTEHLGFEFKYSDFESSYINVSSIYRINPKRESSFFWKGGVGRYVEMIDGGNTFNLGAGYEALIDDKMSFVFGVDSVYQKNIHAVDWVPYVGFSYLIGDGRRDVMKKPQVKAPPKVLDSDNDGVADDMDKCPATVAGAAVDANGCEIDSDLDGVVDRLDACPNTPAGAKVDDKGCRIVLTEDVSIALNVQFANNSNIVTDAYRVEIKKVADFMKQYPDTSAVIEGHTDSRGAAAYNQSLSLKRATAVMQYLISEFGIDQARVVAEGKGEESPVASNDSAEGRAANRRVQAEIKTSVSKLQ